WIEVDGLELSDAGHVGEDCFADRGQECNHRFESVNPTQIKEEHNVGPGLFQASDQLWQTGERPILHDRVHNDVSPGRGNTPCPAQDVHVKSELRQKLTDV